MYCFCRFSSEGLECSVSQDQATVPGLIQPVLLSFDGAARSSTIVDWVTVARSPTAAVRHGGDRGRREVTVALSSATVNVPDPDWWVRLPPAYRPSRLVSASSAYAPPDCTSAGTRKVPVAAPPTVVWTGYPWSSRVAGSSQAFDDVGTVQDEASRCTVTEPLPGST